VSFEGPGVVLSGGEVLPVLEPPAAAALRAAVAAQGGDIHINSAFRTIAQQYLLYRWMGQCGIQIAAQPGHSNHESGLALDVADFTAWQGALEAQGWRWYGDGDRVHYDFVSGGTDLRGNSVMAFQRLWNRNHPEDRIDEDGVYGPMTESRLASAPAEGFAIHGCQAPPPPPPDGGTMTPDLPPAPDGGGDPDGPPLPSTADAGSDDDSGIRPDRGRPDTGPDDGDGGPDPASGLAGGCQVGTGPASGTAPLTTGLLLTLALGLLASRRRSR
jgi:MYXO-CTERM domain-containing protein